MPRTCSADNCSSPVFGGGYCKFHGFKRRMFGGDLYQANPKRNQSPEARSPKRHTKIPHESKTRTEERKHYAEHCRELTQEIRDANNGKIYCFFSGQEIKGNVVYHHLLGRSGDYYTDKDLLVPCDNDVHLEYHRSTVEQLQKTDWYAGFLVRLKSKSLEAYNKEQRKLQKALFDEQ